MHRGDVMANARLNEAAERLWKAPSEKNWKSFGAAIKRGKVKYYNVVFSKGKLAKTDDLREAYVELYDAKERQVAKAPVYVSKGKGVEGATIYLKGLLNINK